MIEPNMATMLCYILTDLKISKEKLINYLSKAVKKSFNSISVDGDQSTSDTVLVLSSNKIEADDDDHREFQASLENVCTELAEDIVRNGEGTQHVIKITVTGAPTDNIAAELGKFVINSNLFKCAIAGSDPNVGRIVAAIGSYFGSRVVENVDFNRFICIKIGGTIIFENGSFSLDPVKEKTLSDYLFEAQLYPVSMLEHERTFPMHYKNVEMDIIFSNELGYSGSAVVIGSDLTKEYVEINADYRS